MPQRVFSHSSFWELEGVFSVQNCEPLHSERFSHHSFACILSCVCVFIFFPFLFVISLQGCTSQIDLFSFSFPAPLFFLGNFLTFLYNHFTEIFTFHIFHFQELLFSGCFFKKQHPFLNSLTLLVGNANQYSHDGKQCLHTVKKLEIELPYDPEIPFLGIYTEETRSERDTCIPMFIAALFIIARTWKQPRCPSADKWIRKL